MMYGKWIDLKDEFRPDRIKMEDEHTKMGEQLTERLNRELGTKYKVKLPPSSNTKMYAGSDFLFNDMPFTSITIFSNRAL
ncbi:hypothetical protein ABWK26_11780 [Bacillus toyonensis]|uniref:hypothetical protein n=1 Tax=Bacillus toyonensis TaxID=155322 RepID=UPI002FFEEB36